MKGFFNTCLTVDLDNGRSRAWSIDDRVLKSWLGGKGLGTYLLLRSLKPNTDPLSRDNVLILTPGIAAGVIPGTSRYGVYAKSPLTNAYGESYSGGSLAPAFKAAGYDAVLIKGRYPKPAYLVISPGEAAFEDASSLWGLSSYEAEKQVLKEVGEKKARALTIGPAGENLVRFACITNDYWRNAGRCGLGAVMGSKNLKALVFHGDREVEFGNAEKLREFSRRLRERSKKSRGVENFRKYGTLNMASLLNHLQGFPTRYWSDGSFEDIEKINANYLLREMDAKPKACYNCFIACGKLSKVKKGRHAGLKIEGPEYETVFAFGGLCAIASLEEIAYLNDLCDSLGLDTITAGSLIALVMHASQRKLLDYKLEYGDSEGAIQLLKDIAYRRNLGATLAEGIKPTSQKLKLQELAMHVKGLDLPGYDPRVLRGMALAYGTSARGACHLRATYYKAELSGAGFENPEKKAEDYIDYEDRLTLFDSIIMCKFYRDLMPWEEIKKCLGVLTGVNYGFRELRETAGRIVTATRVFNYREGFGKSDDALPPRLHQEPLNGKVLAREEYDAMLHAYYRFRGWSREGVPKDNKIKEVLLRQ